MTFEDDKLTTALNSLHELERRCTLGSGIFRSFKNLFVTTSNQQEFSYADSLETQIILADSQLCIAILTFLQQDISGYFKGGWVLRKSWKLYQQLFKEVGELYEKNIGKLQLPGKKNMIGRYISPFLVVFFYFSFLSHQYLNVSNFDICTRSTFIC